MYNKENYPEITLLRYIPLDNYANLKSEFRSELFKIIISKMKTQRKLAKILSVKERRISTWKLGYGRLPLRIVMKCTELSEISKDEIYQNILDITSWREAGRFSVYEWRLPLKEEFSEWLGILKGDGSISSKAVVCSNTCLEIINFFNYYLEKLFSISKNRIKIIIEFPTNKKLEAIDAENRLKQSGYKNIKLYESKPYKLRKKVFFTSGIYSNALSEMLKNLFPDLKQLLFNSPNTVKAAYVRGFSATEGSVGQSNTFRQVTIIQNNLEELLFIKNLLKSLGIINIYGPRRATNSFQLQIVNRIELEKFRKLIGFGRHREKNEKLDKIIANYKQFHKPQKVRYEEILDVLKNGKLAGQEIALKLKMPYRSINRILNSMLSRNLIQSSNRRPFNYFLSRGYDES